MGGIPPRTDAALAGWVDEVVDRAGSPIRAAAMAAEALANRHGHSLVGTDLAVADEIAGLGSSIPAWPADAVGGSWGDEPYLIGRAYELALAPDQRRRSGSHLTRASIARGVVGCLNATFGARHRSLHTASSVPVVLDPAVGGGAFLVAVADAVMADAAMTGSEVDPELVLGAMRGVDISADAVAAADAALAVWGLDHGVNPASRSGLIVGDGLLLDLGTADIVVGNPPFLNQLHADSSNTGPRRDALRDKWGDLVKAYTDEAWLFLAAGLAALAPGGRLAMLNPISVLGARDAGPVRARVGDRGGLAGIWLAGAKVFDAQVDVCAVVAGTDPQTTVRRWHGPDFDPEPHVQDHDLGDESASWGPVVADLVGIPRIDLALAGSGGTVGDRAKVTAGFRDQFYGFVPYVYDLGGDLKGQGEPSNGTLVTVGMIDPFELRWGLGEYRFAGHKYRSPVVDLDALAAGDPRLAAWTGDRLRPKILVATQTRVIEAWVDVGGRVVPATPVISIEPLEIGGSGDPADIDPDSLWLLAAAVASPVNAARLAAESYGTAMSASALKVSASALAQVPLPVDGSAWYAAAAAVRELHQPELDPASRAEMVVEFAAAATAAYRHHDPQLVEWWLPRLA